MESSDAHRINEGLVLHALVAAGANSRQQIVRKTDLSKATVSRLVRDLIKADLVVEGPLVSGPDGGRATQTLEFTGAKELVCGVDVGGTNTRFVIADQQGRLVEAWRARTMHARSGREIAAWTVDQLATHCSVLRRRGLAATVIGVPGVVVPTTNSVEQVPNLRGMAGTDFYDSLTSKLPGRVAIVNDSNVALRGEMLAGAAGGARDVVMVTLGTGVGAGVALDGHPLSGERGLVGEFGLLPVDSDGSSVEDVLSGRVVRGAVKSLRALGTRAAAKDDPGEHEVRDRILHSLFALGMAVTVAYDPEVVVFGGRVSESLGAALTAVRARMAERLAAPPRLVLSQLGDAAGAIGAVGSALVTAHELLGAISNQADAATAIPAIRTLSEAVVTRLGTTTRSTRHGVVARHIKSGATSGAPIGSSG